MPIPRDEPDYDDEIGFLLNPDPDLVNKLTNLSEGDTTQTVPVQTPKSGCQILSKLSNYLTILSSVFNLFFKLTYR